MTTTEELPVEATPKKNQTRTLALVGMLVVLALAAVLKLRSDSTPFDVTDTYVRSQPGPQPLFDVPTSFGPGFHIENGKLAGGAGDEAAKAAVLAGSKSELLRHDLNADGFDELIVNLTVSGQDPGFFVVQSFEQEQRVVLQGRGSIVAKDRNLTQTTVAGEVIAWQAQADSAGRIFGFARIAPEPA